MQRGEQMDEVEEELRTYEGVEEKKELEEEKGKNCSCGVFFVAIDD